MLYFLSEDITDTCCCSAAASLPLLHKGMFFGYFGPRFGCDATVRLGSVRTKIFNPFRCKNAKMSLRFIEHDSSSI